MKRIDNSDVNIKLESKLVYLLNFNAKFYTINAENFFIRKNQDDVFTAQTEDGITEYYIKLDWAELVTMGEGVLQYQIVNNIPDEDRADLQFNRYFERTTEYYVNSNVTVDPETESSFTEVIAELEEKVDAEITRSTSADTVMSNAIDAETTRATNAESALSTSIESKYEKPSGGIPKSDLASSVQTSLGKADTALQSFTETDPTVPAWAKAETKPTYTANEVGAIENREIFDGDIRQSGNTYINLLDDALYASDKRFVTSIEVKDASGNTISTSPIPNNCFNLVYDGGALNIESGTTAILTIKGGEDITAETSKMLTYGQGYLYVHFYSAVNNLPKSITGRIYKQYSPAGYQTLTFTLMENPPCCYTAPINSNCVNPSAIEITIEGDDSRSSQIVEIEWWTKRKHIQDLPLMSKYKNETLYYPLTLNSTLTANNYITATGFKVSGSSNNYVLLGNGNTKPISDFALASSLSSYYTKTEIDNKKFVSSSTSGLKIEVVNELPQTPDNDTIYIIR